MIDNKVDLGEINLEEEIPRMKKTYGLLIVSLHIPEDYNFPIRPLILGALDDNNEFKRFEEPVEILRVLGVQKIPDDKKDSFPEEQGGYIFDQIIDVGYLKDPDEMTNKIIQCSANMKYPYLKVIYCINGDYNNRREFFCKNLYL
jgi:hypothetical protein